MARIDSDENILKRDIAIRRRDERNLLPAAITDRTRLCINCNQSIRLEIEAIEIDPRCNRLNVLTRNHYRTCLLCNTDVNLHRKSIESRVNIFVNVNIYVPGDVRICNLHIDENGFVFRALQDGLQFINRPYIIDGQELQIVLQLLRGLVVDKKQFVDVDSISDEEFTSLSPISKVQFNELYEFCRPVPRNDRGFRHVSKRDLLMFLCKMKEGLADDFLKVIFAYSSRQAASLTVDTVRKSLMQIFVPQNIGFDAITPHQYVAEHVTEFANALYNPNPEIPRVIECMDGTYSYIHKIWGPDCSNFRALRQSFCLHKSSHLLKPVLIVAPDGYILAIQGPYFSDSRNNDASILRNEFDRDNDRMSEWFQEGSIMIVDRGYRDATEMLTNRGIIWKMPALLRPPQRQLTTDEANQSRLITKSRWIVEMRNGHLKTMFKFLGNIILHPHIHNLNEFYQIAGAIINRFHPTIHIEGANAELAARMLRRAQEVNVVQQLVEVEMLHTRNARRWIALNAALLPDFPELTIQYLKDLTFGVYQVRLAPSYVQDKIQRQNEEEIFVEVQNPQNERAIPGLLRMKKGSRFRNITLHQLWIAYKPVEEQHRDDAEVNEEGPIIGYYCTCKSDARTLGTCAHVASVLWFLGYARNEQNVHYPSSRIFETIMDAGNRPPPVNPINFIERMEDSD
ncbi:uncharacterized protein LOC122499719 [Leptopilina heterotoma]|uniref:uncharacterized protein LOC122499719 n=1 Tax=Leptopilina heterotoma TaxID=63436 RepID=UPI001CA9A963|nr:uncharacterized protein LOC122499719 [Leptopilina heterotoma]